MNLAYLALGISVTLVISAITFAFKYGKWQGEVNSDRESFRSFINEIRNDIKDILKRLPPTPVTSASPIRLTELGEKISLAINAGDWAKAEAGKLVCEVEGKDQFEIQSIAFQYANEFEPFPDLLKKMHTCAFDNGMDLSGVREVLGVELRDVLLSHHSLKPSSLDKQNNL